MQITDKNNNYQYITQKMRLFNKYLRCYLIHTIQNSGKTICFGLQK